jgi:hypothetical protein
MLYFSTAARCTAALHSLLTHTTTVLHTAALSQQAAVARAGGVSPPRLHRRVSPPNIPPIVGRGTAPGSVSGTVSGTVAGTVSGTVLPGPPPRHSAPAPPSILPRPVSDPVIGSDNTAATAAGAAGIAGSSGLGRRYSDNTAAATGGAATTGGGIRSSVIMSDVQSVSSAGPEPSHRASIISTLSGMSGMSSADARSSVVSTTSGATEAASDVGGAAATVTTAGTTSTATGAATGGATTSSSSTASASVRGYTTLREGGGLGALNGTGSATGQSELQELRGLDLPINTFSCTVGLKLSQVRCR